MGIPKKYLQRFAELKAEIAKLRDEVKSTNLDACRANAFARDAATTCRALQAEKMALQEQAKFWSSSQAAEWMGVSEHRLHCYVEYNGMPAARLPDGSRRFDQAAVREWLENDPRCPVPAFQPAAAKYFRNGGRKG